LRVSGSLLPLPLHLHGVIAANVSYSNAWFLYYKCCNIVHHISMCPWIRICSEIPWNETFGWVGVTFCKNLQHVPIPASRSHLSWHWTRRNCGLAGWARSETGRWTCPVENGYIVYYCSEMEAFSSRTLIVYYFVWLVGFLVWDFQLDKKFSVFEVTTIFITVFK
jgi:hypothetical protein